MTTQARPPAPPTVRYEITLRSLLLTAAVVAGAWVLIQLIPVLLVIVAALILAGTLDPAVQWFERHGQRRFVAVGIVFGGAAFFLVALGVDYNIFLVTRIREETPQLGTREAVRVGVAVTGGVITSAGILLAAVFAVVGVLPLIVLTQIGVVVGIGVLLDTLLVRTVLVPALFALLGHRVWWPSSLDVPGGRHRQTRLTASTSDVPSAR